MQLLDEIVDLAIDNQASISVLLRKCLVLAHQLKNDLLRSWTEKELNGYNRDDGLPEYRKLAIIARGLFIGTFGRSIQNQPLQSSVMNKEHRHFATTATLTQPIISYEGTKDASEPSKFVIPWPADLTVRYQTKFIEDFTLNRAWQEIPASVFPALIDTVRNRVLRFALELSV
jgi:AbiTii